MMLPRLIIADETQEGKVPASLLLIQALRNRQIPVNVFFCGRSEQDLRLMNLMSDAPVFCLDAYTMSSPRNLKTLFQRRASEEALNIVSVPLGSAVDEKTFQVRPEGPELAKILDCGVVPVITASHAAVMTTNLVLMAMSAFDEILPGRVMGLILASLKSSRDFQLQEKELNRRSPLLTLGFMPAVSDCSMPSMRAMSADNPSLTIIPVKSAALQLGGQVRQVDWQVLDALARLCGAWSAPEPHSYPARNMDVAVVGPAESLEGEGNLEVFRLMGCAVYGYDHRKDPFPISAGAIYFPHTLNEPYIEELLKDVNFRKGVLASVQSNKLILATGASALLFGEAYRTSDQRKLEGLRIFPYSGNSTQGAHNRKHAQRRVEMRGITDSCFTGNNEKLRGCTVGGFTIANPGNLAAPCLAYREMREDVEMGLTGWVHSYCFVTDLRLDLWSAMEPLNRWLNRKRKAPSVPR